MAYFFNLNSGSEQATTRAVAVCPVAIRIIALSLFVMFVQPEMSRAEQLFKIGTGAPSGAYHPIGQAMAAALSEPGQLAVQAQATSGSLANVSAVGAEQLASGFSQADVAAWHYSGTGPVKPAAKLESLRLIATLYPEHVHVVVRKRLNLQSVAQLKGLRVGMDEPGSGVLINARQILRAYGLSERDIVPSYVKGALALERFKEGGLDAFFYVGGVPSSVISALASDGEIMLLSIAAKEAESLRAANAFFMAGAISDNAYIGVSGVTTLAVGAQWITHVSADEKLIYSLTKKLFSPASLALVKASHPSAQTIGLQSTVQRGGLLLHPGAERFYREIGAMK